MADYTSVYTSPHYWRAEDLAVKRQDRSEDKLGAKQARRDDSFKSRWAQCLNTQHTKGWDNRCHRAQMTTCHGCYQGIDVFRKPIQNGGSILSTLMEHVSCQCSHFRNDRVRLQTVLLRAISKSYAESGGALTLPNELRKQKYFQTLTSVF